MQRQSEERSRVEEKLRNKIVEYFTQLERKILTTYQKATDEGIPVHNITVLIDMLFEGWHREYTETINHYHTVLRKLNQRQIEELIQLQRKRTLGQNRTKKTLSIKPFITLNDTPITTIQDTPLAVKASLDDFGLTTTKEPKMNFIIEANPITAQKIEQTNFKFSEKTRNRVNKDIRDILKKTETEGIGPRQVGRQIQKRFSQLKGYEAERIARTECLRASNTYRYETLATDDLLDYYQWYSNIDHKTRGQKKGDKANHIKMHGEIVRKGELFSNGLRFPGDPNAPAYETINCRCTLVPYIVPWDRIAPAGKTHFKESDLIPKPEDTTLQVMLESLEATNFITPVEEGFQVTPSNLRINGKDMRQWLERATTGITGGVLTTLGELQGHFQKFISPHTPRVVKPTRRLHLHDIFRNAKTYTPPTTTGGLPVNGTHSKPIISKPEVDKLSFEELSEYYNSKYRGLLKYDYDGKKYHTFTEIIDGQEFTIRFEEGAVKSFTKAGIASPNEIIQEVMRAPPEHKLNTEEIWFKNTNHGIEHRVTKSGYDSLGFNVGGYNLYRPVYYKGRQLPDGSIIDSPKHQIVINPKNFKGGGKGQYAYIWEQEEGQIINWIHTIRHEMTHSADTSIARFKNGLYDESLDEEYRAIVHEEPWFTSYANTAIAEDYAEHGGYVSYMLDHPEHHMKKIRVKVKENGMNIKKNINFEEYKEMYPKHYEFFKKQCLKGLL